MATCADCGFECGYVCEPGMCGFTMEDYQLDNFIPTPFSINRLPKPIRKYIHDLQTRCDPAGDVAALTLTRDQNKHMAEALDERDVEYAAALGRAGAAYTLLDKMRQVANNTDLDLSDRCAALLMLTESSKNLDQPSDADEYIKWRFIYSNMKEWVMEYDGAIVLDTEFISLMSDMLEKMREKGTSCKT